MAEVCPGFCKNNVVVLLYEGFQEVQDFKEIKAAFPDFLSFLKILNFFLKTGITEISQRTRTI
jgi:hypothetical protein